MSRVNKGAYSAILRTRMAHRFDIATLLMRLFTYTTTLGTIAMLTLAGASALQATSVSSLIAVSMFFIAPRVSRRIDERGQSRIVPGATAIALAGLALLLANTHFSGPFWMNYLAAPLISFLPNAQAMARARWAYLIDSGKLGDQAPTLKSAYAYEGILEDVAFMTGPASVIALSATLFPVAGMLLGGVVYGIGAALLVSSKDTEPQPGWGSSPSRAGGASVLRAYPVVLVLFLGMVLFGAMYGSLDTSVITYCESIGMAALSSGVFALESLFSVVVSTIFGMLVIASPLRRQYVVFTVLFGALYALFFFVNSAVSLVVIACIAGLSYAPMYITANVTCESAVPSANLTEALSWLVSGSSIGLVIGPVVAGAVVDAWGPMAGFDATALFALAIVLLAVACIPVLRKHLA